MMLFVYEFKIGDFSHVDNSACDWYSYNRTNINQQRLLYSSWHKNTNHKHFSTELIYIRGPNGTEYNFDCGVEDDGVVYWVEL